MLSAVGLLPRLERAPPEVVEHVHARAAELPGERTGPLGRQPDRMVRRCRELVREHAGAVWDPERVRAVAETAMRQALQSKDNPADVINVALEVLSAQRCELPDYSTLDRMAGTLRAEVTASSTAWWPACARRWPGVCPAGTAGRGPGQPAKRVAEVDPAGAEGGHLTLRS